MEFTCKKCDGSYSYDSISDRAKFIRNDHIESGAAKEDCPHCFARIHEEWQNKQKDEWHADFKDMADSDKIDWILEWIREHPDTGGMPQMSNPMFG